MRPNYRLFLLLFVVFGCAKSPDTMLPHLNGYWEISEVTLHDGTKRDYTYNDTVDYMELTDSLSGFRKKLKPNLQGGFETSDNLERFQIKIENDSLNIYYSTPYAQWKETILSADEQHLRVVNNTNKDVYLYKRYEPITLD